MVAINITTNSNMRLESNIIQSSFRDKDFEILMVLILLQIPFLTELLLPYNIETVSVL